MKIYRNFSNKIPFKDFKTSSNKRVLEDLLTEEPDPRLIKSDYIGPPDKDSNLRPIVRCIPKDESVLAKQLREKQIEVANWNKLFWTNHNKRFYQEKEDFIRLQSSSDVSADKLSEFYKSFLDKNHKVHVLYNLSWYIKNFELLFLSFRVAVERLYKKTSK